MHKATCSCFMQHFIGNSDRFGNGPGDIMPIVSLDPVTERGQNLDIIPMPRAFPHR